VSAVAEQLGVPAWELAVGAGEDYELCICIGAGNRPEADSATPLCWVGEVIAGPPEALFSAGGVSQQVQGFHHRR
jgi:thiamine monophosphate kinase